MSRPSGGGCAAILPLAFQADVVLAFSVENVSPSGWRLRRHTSPSPSLGVRASGLNCRARASPGIVGLKPQQADLLRKFSAFPHYTRQAKTICIAYSFTIKPRGGLYMILRSLSLISLRVKRFILPALSLPFFRTAVWKSYNELTLLNSSSLQKKTQSVRLRYISL